MSFQIYSYVFILLGVFTIWGAVAKPVFYWESRRAERLRELMGDKPAEIFYIAIGMVCIVFGILAAMGIVNLT